MKNFAGLAEGTKVQAYDKDGYYIMRFCGIVLQSFECGNAIIQSFEGGAYGTVFELWKVAEVEIINS
jgi:hypothetical protein